MSASSSKIAVDVGLAPIVQLSQVLVLSVQEVLRASHPAAHPSWSECAAPFPSVTSHTRSCANPVAWSDILNNPPSPVWDFFKFHNGHTRISCKPAVGRPDLLDIVHANVMYLAGVISHHVGHKMKHKLR